MPLVLLLIVLFAFPILEIAAFYAVASAIGFASALALLLTTSAIGLLLLRGEALSFAGRFRAALARGVLPTGVLRRGALTALAGFLLVLPGFITDGAALLLLVAAAFDRFGKGEVTMAVRPHGADPPGIVDLEPGEWERQGPRGPTRGIDPRLSQSDAYDSPRADAGGMDRPAKEG